MSVRNQSSEFIGSATQRGASGPASPTEFRPGLDVDIFILNDAGGRIENDPITDPSVRVLFVWTRPVAAWAVTAAGVVWHDDNNKSGRFYAAPSAGAAYVAFLDLPDDSSGRVVITVSEDSATAQGDATIMGPPGDREIVREYDTRTVTATTPAVELINRERATTATSNLHLVWTEPVRNFTTDDITITAGSITALTAIMPNADRSATEFVALWQLPAAGVGTATLTINQFAARGATREGPAVDYVVTIPYTASQVTTIYEDGTTTAATTLISDEQSFDSLKGAYYGVQEMYIHNNRIYATVQKVNNVGSTPTDFLNFTQRGSAELKQVSGTTATTLAKYQDCETAPRGFVSYDSGNGSQLHFIRGSHWLYQYEEDSQGREVQRRKYTDQENWREIAGDLYSLSASAPDLLGVTGYSDLTDPEPVTFSAANPMGHRYDPTYGKLGGTATPLVADSDELYLIPGFGDLSRIGVVPVGNSDDYPETHIYNWVLTAFSKTLQFRIDLLETNDRILFDIINLLAQLTDSVFGYDKNGNFYFHRNTPVSGQLMSAITPTATSFDTKNETHVGDTFIPSSGHVIIGSEVLSYSSISNGVFMGVERGLYETTAAAHSADANVYWINHFVGEQTDIEILVDQYSIVTDKSQIYNSIEVQFGNNKIETVSDSSSITSYGEQVYSISIPASDDQVTLAQWVAEVLLAKTKDPREIITCAFKIEDGITMDVGDTIYFRDPDLAHLAHAGYVVEIQHVLEGHTIIKAVRINV